MRLMLFFYKIVCKIIVWGEVVSSSRFMSVIDSSWSLVIKRLVVVRWCKIRYKVWCNGYSKINILVDILFCWDFGVVVMSLFRNSGVYENS